MLCVAALSCADGASSADAGRDRSIRAIGERAGAGAPRTRDGGAGSARDGGSDGGTASAAGDGGAARVAGDGGAARVAGDGGAGPALRVECRPASAPSWPAVAWIGDAPAIAFYDGDQTRVARVPTGEARELPRIAVMLTSGAEMAAPGLAGRGDAGLLATIEGPVPRHRLLVRRVGPGLVADGPERALAESVDSRYGPALLAFADGWLVGWIDAAAEAGRAMVQRLAPDGSPAAEAQVLSEVPTGAASLALSSHGGRALAAWIDPHLGFSPVVVSWSDAEGRFGAPRIVTTTGSVDRSAMVGAAAGPGETGLVVWAHVGGLGQDFLSQTLLPRGRDPARPHPLNRVDAYATLRAAAVLHDGAFGLAWDAPTTTGRAPPTSVRLAWLDAAGTAIGPPTDLGAGGGVASATGPRGALALAFRRGLSVCVARTPE